MNKDTICALCTAPGKGALSLIRLSGPRALEITRGLADFLPALPESRYVYLGFLKQEKQILDQVLLTYFEKGASFTGEETVEISCHGGEVYSEILKALLKKGARMAEKGEFSLQAFSNGKLDLIQVEGLLQLIESQSSASRLQAFSQLKGVFSDRLKLLEKKWIFLLSHLEADIDFSLEGLNCLDDGQIRSSLKELEKILKQMISSYRPTETLRKGFVMAFFGRTNSGKSSLFNALLAKDQAIVSSEEGTTRDFVEGLLYSPGGINICLTDCAGFRESQSEGEKKGLEKTKKLFHSSDYRILTLDASSLEKEETDLSLFQDISKSLLVFTKKDLLEKEKSLKELTDFLKKKNYPLPPEKQIFFVSAKTGEGLSLLRKKIISFGEPEREDFLISNHRHYKALKIMSASVKNSLNILDKSQGEKDLLALELREGLQALYELLGKQIDDKILDSVFKEFCIGK